MNHENFNVKFSDISDAISELPNDKSPGIDDIMSEHFKNVSYRLNIVISCITSYVKAWVLSKAIHVDYDCSNIVKDGVKMEIPRVNQAIVQ